MKYKRDHNKVLLWSREKKKATLIYGNTNINCINQAIAACVKNYKRRNLESSNVFVKIRTTTNFSITTRNVFWKELSKFTYVRARLSNHLSVSFSSIDLDGFSITTFSHHLLKIIKRLCSSTPQYSAITRTRVSA